MNKQAQCVNNEQTILYFEIFFKIRALIRNLKKQNPTNILRIIT